MAGALGVVLLSCSCGTEPDAPGAMVRVVGHRGAAGLAPENTLAALDRAQAAGAREVEVDVRLSRDGVPFLFHDRTLDRKTQFDGAVSDRDWQTLRRAEIGRWFHQHHPQVRRRYDGTRLTRLDEALASYGDAFVWHLELKGREEALPEAVIAAVDRAGLRARVVVSSFLTPQLRAIQDRAPDLRVCLNVPRSRERAESAGGPRRLTPDEGIERAIEEGYAMAALALEDVDEGRVERPHDHGVEVLAYRVRNDADLERALVLGVDAVAVPDPGRALAFLARRAAVAR